MLHGRCCSIAQLPYLFQVTIRANPSYDLLVHYRLVLMMDRSAKLSLWLETFDMALFILSFFKRSRQKVGGLSKKRLCTVLSLTPAENQFNCYIVEKSEIDSFLIFVTN